MALRTIAAAAAILVLVGAAQAEPVQRIDWTGPYVSIGAGAAATGARATLAGAFGEIILDDVRKGIFPRSRDNRQAAASVGFGGGYARQRGAVVLGVELAFSPSAAEARHRFVRTDTDPFGPAAPFGGSTTRTDYLARIDRLASLRLRAGVAEGETLVYATGGLAVGRVSNRFVLGITDIPEAWSEVFDGTSYRRGWSQTETRLGYVIGVGIERRVSPRTSVKLEILHYDLGRERVAARETDIPAFFDQGIDYRFRNTAEVAQVGISIRF